MKRTLLGTDPVTSEESAPIAPMTPKKRCGLGRQDSADPETGHAEAGPSEEYLTLETTSEAGVQVLSLRQLGQAAQGTIMSVATQTITGQSTDAKELLPGTSTACPIDDDDPAASPSKRLKADVRTGYVTSEKCMDVVTQIRMKVRRGAGTVGYGEQLFPHFGTRLM